MCWHNIFPLLLCPYIWEACLHRQFPACQWWTSSIQSLSIAKRALWARMVLKACAALIMDHCFWRINQKAAKITSPPGSVLPAWMNRFTAAAVQMKPPHAFSSVISLWCFLSSPALVNQTGLKERAVGWNFPLLPSALRASASCDPSAAAVWAYM